MSQRPKDDGRCPHGTLKAFPCTLCAHADSEDRCLHGTLRRFKCALCVQPRLANKPARGSTLDWRCYNLDCTLRAKQKVKPTRAPAHSPAVHACPCGNTCPPEKRRDNNAPRRTPSAAAGKWKCGNLSCPFNRPWMLHTVHQCKCGDQLAPELRMVPNSTTIQGLPGGSGLAQNTIIWENYEQMYGKDREEFNKKTTNALLALQAKLRNDPTLTDEARKALLAPHNAKVDRSEHHKQEEIKHNHQKVVSKNRAVLAVKVMLTVETHGVCQGPSEDDAVPCPTLVICYLCEVHHKPGGKKTRCFGRMYLASQVWYEVSINTKDDGTILLACVCRACHIARHRSTGTHYVDVHHTAANLSRIQKEKHEIIDTWKMDKRTCAHPYCFTPEEVCDAREKCAAYHCDHKHAKGSGHKLAKRFGIANCVRESDVTQQMLIQELSGCQLMHAYCHLHHTKLQHEAKCIKTPRNTVPRSWEDLTPEEQLAAKERVDARLAALLLMSEIREFNTEDSPISSACSTPRSSGSTTPKRKREEFEQADEAYNRAIHSSMQGHYVDGAGDAPLRQMLSSLSLQEHDVDGDGNCAFHAIRHQLVHHGIDVQDSLNIDLNERGAVWSLRKAFSSAVISDWSHYRELLTQTSQADVRRFADTSEWDSELGDQVIRAMARLLDINILILHPDGHVIFINSEGAHVPNTDVHDLPERTIQIVLRMNGARTHYSSTAQVP